MTTKTTIPRADKSWRKDVKLFWYEILREFELSRDGLELLRMSCDQLERNHQSKDLISKIGLIYQAKDKNGNPTGILKKNPALEAERSSRAGFVQCIKALGIDIGDPPNRPGKPGVYGI